MFLQRGSTVVYYPFTAVHNYLISLHSPTELPALVIYIPHSLQSLAILTSCTTRGHSQKGSEAY